MTPTSLRPKEAIIIKLIIVLYGVINPEMHDHCKIIIIIYCKACNANVVKNVEFLNYFFYN